MSEELEEQVRRSVERVAVPEPAPLDQVARRARRIRVRRYVSGALTAAVVVGAGIGGPAVLLSSLNGGPAGAPTVVGSAAAGAPLPDVAEIVCDGTTTQVLTPQVKPQPDGVHFRVDNRRGEQLSLQVQPYGPASSGGGGGNAEVGVHESDISKDFPPGPYGVRCQKLAEDAGSDEGYVPMEVVDQDGLWVSDDLECGPDAMASTLFIDYAAGTKGPHDDPLEIFQSEHAADIEQGDEVRTAGYPESENPTVVVIRAGLVVAAARYYSDGFGGWLESPYSECSVPVDGGVSGGGSSGSTGTG